jgi:hypothetical protein
MLVFSDIKQNAYLNKKMFQKVNVFNVFLFTGVDEAKEHIGTLKELIDAGLIGPGNGFQK